MICMTFRSRPRLILKDSCLYRVFTWGRGYVVLYNMGYVFASHTPMYMRHSHSHSSCIGHLLLVDLGVPPQASSIRCPAYYMRRATVQAQQHATIPLPVGGELTGRDNRSPPPDSLQIICKNAVSDLLVKTLHQDCPCHPPRAAIPVPSIPINFLTFFIAVGTLAAFTISSRRGKAANITRRKLHSSRRK